MLQSMCTRLVKRIIIFSEHDMIQQINGIVAVYLTVSVHITALANRIVILTEHDITQQINRIIAVQLVVCVHVSADRITNRDTARNNTYGNGNFIIRIIHSFKRHRTHNIYVCVVNDLIDFKCQFNNHAVSIGIFTERQYAASL